jgi:hypothetical protein
MHLDLYNLVRLHKILRVAPSMPAGERLAQLCGQEASSSDAPAAVGFGAAPSAWVGCWHQGLFAVSRQRATVIVRSYYLASEPCHGHSDDAYDHRQDGGA